MTIETKFSVGDTVYYMRNDMVNHGMVTGMKVQVFSDGNPKDLLVRTYYSIGHKEDQISAEKCFASKEELINSL